MSRPLRIQYAGAWYHVMNRGRRGEAVFADPDDYTAFTELLREASQMWGIKIAAYCMMQNHYHLLVQTPEANLSRCMRHINGVYTQKYNRKYGNDGQLFRGRYKSILVEADNYLLELVRYIHRNPLRAGVVKRPDEYKWSSHRGYLSNSNKWNWIEKDFILSMLPGSKSVRSKAYKDFMKEEEAEGIKKIFKRKKLPAIIGTKRFIDRIKKKYYGDKYDKDVPESSVLAPEIEDIKKIVSHTYKTKSTELAKIRRGEGNEPRKVVIYLIRKHTGETLERIAEEFNMSKYSSAGSVFQKES